MLKTLGHTQTTELDVQKLPAAVNSDGDGVLNKVEVELIKSTRDGYLRFMHLLRPKNIALLDLLEREGR